MRSHSSSVNIAAGPPPAVRCYPDLDEQVSHPRVGGRGRRRPVGPRLPDSSAGGTVFVSKEGRRSQVVKSLRIMCRHAWQGLFVSMSQGRGILPREQKHTAVTVSCNSVRDWVTY